MYATTTDEALGSVNAFRSAEKRYQLHLEQRISQGRRKRVTHVPRPTDLSGVVDIRHLTPEVAAALGVTVVPVQGCDQFHPEQQQQQPPLPHQAGSSAASMLLFAAHPGLAVFPAALSGLCQLQLMRAALQDWPQPPARTNHTAVYGDLLCGLFQAAQAGLSLQQQQQEDEQLGSCQAQCQQPQQEEQLDNRQQQQQQQQQQHQQQEDRLDDGQTQYHHQQQQQHCEDSRSSPQPPTDVVWSGTGRGPKAALLLRKLRWVCLGPPYDWTRRMYDTHLRHTQLPPGLAALARHFAALAAAAAAGEGPAAGAGHVPAARAEFVPDAALVNYYHPGDTLNGHRDDVEPDLAQPIVTLSLGCDAVFLKGAESRDVAPSALLLRSGDVVVLGGRARRCYHGVPRVFDGWQVPNGVAAAAEAQQQSYGAVVQHMRNSRINVSIRAIH